MKPISLTLRGFIGIKKGMGLDEVSIDLSNLSGLVAFDGKNGSGKTTVLDNLHAYRRLASRDGSLQHHVFLRDSYKEFIFDFSGHRYKTLVKIDAHSGRQEGFIWKDDEPQVSGKATEYDKYIEGLLGSPKLFFQSVFAAQGGDSIADMTTGELKNLFSEFLQLDKLERYEESAKQAGNAIQAEIDTIKQRIETAREQIAGHSDLKKALPDKETDLSYKQTKAEEVRKAITRIESELKTATDKAAEHRAAKQRKQELARQKSELEQQLTGLETAWEKYGHEVTSKTMDLDEKIKVKESALQGIRRTQAMKEELDQLDSQLQEKERDLETGQKEINFAQQDIDDKTKALHNLIYSANKDMDDQQLRMNELTQELQKAERSIHAYEQELRGLENDGDLNYHATRVKELKAAIKKKDRLPAECNPNICPFIADARQAEIDLPAAEREYRDRLQEVEDEVSVRQKTIKAKKAQEEEIQKNIDHATERKRQLAQELERQKQTMNDQIAHMTKSRDAAKAYVEQLQKDIKEIKRRQAEIRTDLDGMPNYEALQSEIKVLKDRHKELSDDYQSRHDEHWKQKGNIKSKISEIDSTIAELPLDPDAENLVKEKTAELDNQKTSIRALEDQISQLKSDIAVLQHRLDEHAKIEQQITAEQEKVDELAKELTEWRYIQQACGKDGLRALEIDGTAPLIAGYANDLLTATFGPGATVGFRTLNDDGKECLDVVVYREDDADENGTLLENLSGGQKVWILKALRLALTLVAKQKSGKDIAAALSDEEDGALDAENAMAFIGLYRAFMDAGGFSSCLYITHRDACKAMADHVIRLTTDKGIEIDSSLMSVKAA